MIDRRGFAGAAAIATLGCAVGVAPAWAQVASRIAADDYYAIVDLNARFCHGLDSGERDGALFASTFTPDGVFLDGERRLQGTAQLAALARATRDKGATNVAHLISNILVEPAPGGARQYSYLQIVGTVADGRRVVVAGGQYWDDLARTAQGWRIRRRTFLKPGTPRPDPQAIFTPGDGAPAASTSRTDPLTAADRAQIIQLYAHYAVSLDKFLGDGADFADLFTPDGSATDAAGTTITGRAALARLAWANSRVDAKTYVTNIMIEPTAAGANVRAYVMGANIPSQGEQIMAPRGMFFDQLVRTAAGWRFRSKTLVAPGAPVPAALAARLSAPRPGRVASPPRFRAAAGAMTAQDYADIHLVYARYAHGFDSCVDHGAWYLGTFTPDATFTDQYDGESVGRKGLDATYVRGRNAVPIAFSHATWNVMIDPAPWGAAGRAYTGGGRANDPGKPPASPGLVGDYTDILVRTTEGWQFQQRRFRQDFIRPGRPANGPPPPATPSR